MQRFKILIMVVSLLGIIGAAILIINATTTFNGSTIVGVDQAQLTVAFQTREGETWILPVRDPSLLSSATISNGDRVSIGVDWHNQVSKITKLSEQMRKAMAHVM